MFTRNRDQAIAGAHGVALPLQSGVFVEVCEVVEIKKFLCRWDQNFMRSFRMRRPAIELGVQAIYFIQVGVCKFGNL